MSLTEPTIIERGISAWKKLPALDRAIVIGVALLFILGFVLFVSAKLSSWKFRSNMQASNANLANAFDKLANIQDKRKETEANLHQLDIDEAAQKQVVIDAAKDKEKALAAERDAAIAANQANANSAAVNAVDFNGTSLENAEKARCAAFPENCK